MNAHEAEKRINLLSMLKEVWLHFSSCRRKQYFYFLILSFVSGFVEVISLGAVVPFIGVLTTPEIVFEYGIVKSVSPYLGITSADDLILPMTILFILIALVANSIRLLLLWVTNKLSFESGADISRKIFLKTISQPYSVHVLQNSSEVINSVVNKAGGVVGMLYACISLINSSVIVVFLLIALISLSPMVTGSTFILLALLYLTIALLAKRKLNKNSEVYARESTKVIKNLQEVLGGIRDVILDGTHELYYKLHSNTDRKVRYSLASNNFIGGSPRYIMEAIVMMVIALIAYNLSMTKGGLINVLPLLAAMAMGAQRLLPLVQQIYISWSNIKGGQASLSDVITILELPDNDVSQNLIHDDTFFCENISFENVWFRYTNDTDWVLKGINLRITKGEIIGFIGNTGCGKSTILDIAMGLLKPTKGYVLVDGNNITDLNCKLWQSKIAHVPQNIFLSDNTILENIAFGVSENNIDHERVYHSAKKAQISDFVETMENKYLTEVGERGIRLSGGQKQRIGIARALYKKADVLVLDEATSALDNKTELSVMESIESLKEGLTIFIIAHRLTTLEGCDKVIELKSGTIALQGTYDEVINNRIDTKEPIDVK